MRILDESGPLPASCVVDHVALPDTRPSDRAFVRLNMIASADGGTAVAGVSGGLGNRDDHAVFAALAPGGRRCARRAGHRRRRAVPGAGATAAAALRRRRHARRERRAGPVRIAAARRSCSPTTPGRCPMASPSCGRARARSSTSPRSRRAGGARARRRRAVRRWPGLLVADGLVDEFFVTIAPRSSPATRRAVAHGPDADAVTLEPGARLRRRRRLPVPPLRTELTAVAWVRGGGRGIVRR